MSKQEAIRFILMKDVNEEIKHKCSILCKYAGKSLSKDEWNNIILHEIIPYAKARGFDFSLSDLLGLKKSDDEMMAGNELDQADSGRGQFTRNIYSNYSVTHYCKAISDDQTFQANYFQSNNSCTNYDYEGNAPEAHDCAKCKHFTYGVKLGSA